MKRNSLLLCLLLVFTVYISGTAQAQSVQQLPKLKEKYTAEFTPTVGSGSHAKRDVQSDWFSIRSIFTNAGKTVSGGIFTLFPDTTVLIKFTGSAGQDTFDAPFFHSVGNIWDFRAGTLLGNPFNIDSTYSYTVDSIAIPYLYTRWNPDPNIVDTIYVQFYDNGGIRNTGIGADDVALGNIAYNYNLNKGLSQKMDMKILLTASDTAAGLPGGQPGTIIVNKNVISEVTGLTIPKNSRLGLTMNFIPGYDYSKTMPYDTLEADSSTFKRLNQFKVIRLSIGELFKESTTAVLPSKNRIYMNGLFISSDIRGNTSAGGWNGTYYPGIYTTSGGGGFATNYMDISVKITAVSTVGIAKANADGYAMGNVYPNPTDGQDVMLNFSIAKTQPVTLTLANVIGQTIKSATETFTAGENSMIINTSDLQPGIYFYTLTSGNFSQTKKLTVSK